EIYDRLTNESLSVSLLPISYLILGQKVAKMTVSVELHRNGRVLLQVYSDPLTMDEILVQQDWIVREVLSNATQPIHSIVDACQVTRLPGDILSRGIGAVKTVHPQGGQI